MWGKKVLFNYITFDIYFMRSPAQSAGGCNNAQSTAERSYPTSEVRGRIWEDPKPEGRQPKGATPHPRSRVAAGRNYSTSEVRGGSRKELSCI